MGAVLIVDDNPADRALFRRVLARAGYTVHEASRGADALAKAREVRPHLVVLDVNLPDTDGHAVCRELKAGAETGAVPVLMLTVRDNDADVLAGLEAGADDYVAKDADPAIVLARVRRLIEFRRLASLAVLNEHLVQVGRLLAGIVHEIRGPLSVIRGSAELLKIQTQDDDPTRQWVEPILRSTKLLQVRLEHLMATVRSGAGRAELLEVGPILIEAADMFVKGTDPRGAKIRISTDCPPGLPYVRADPGRLIQVLLSLFGNAHEAMSHAGRGGLVKVKTTCEQADGRECVVIEVADDGPGIPELHLNRIFEPFFTTKESGSGFGLYLAAELIKEQGGEVSACNHNDGGACFTVRLPAARLEPLPST